MKKYIHYLKIIIFGLLFTFTSNGNVKASDNDSVGIKFQRMTLQEGLAASKAANKPLYIHGYTDWCHFCMYMKDSVYPDKEVGDFFNKNFVCIKIDMEKEGKELNKSLAIHTYPAMLFYDINGELMHRAAGRRYKQPFLELGKEALDPRRQMRTFKNKYDSGTATPYEVQFYFRMQEIAGMDAQLMIDDYLKKQPDSSFTNANNWRIMYDIIKDPTLSVMKRIIDNKKQLESKYTADSVNNKFINLYNSYLTQFVQQLDSVGFEAAKRSLRANKKLDLSEKICAYADLNKIKMKSDYDKYKAEGKKFIETYSMDDFRRINDICGVLYEKFSTDHELMAQVEKWMQHSVSIGDYYKGNHLLASVTYILGKKEEALKIANHAVDLGKLYANDYRQTTQLIQVIQKY